MEAHPLFVSAMMAVTSAVIFLPLLLPFKSDLTALSTRSIGLLLLTGLLWSVIAEILYVTGFQRAPSLTTASLMTLFYPLLSTILAVWILHEPLTVKTLVAAVLMIGGFILLAI